MSTTAYQANTRDMKFVLWEQLGVGRLFSVERHKDVDREACDMVLDQAAKFAEQELGPANQEGDRQECRLEKGWVYAPSHFCEILKKFRGA